VFRKRSPIITKSPPFVKSFSEKNVFSYTNDVMSVAQMKLHLAQTA